MLYLPEAWTRLKLHGDVTKKHFSTAHFLYVPRFCAAKEYQSHVPKQAFSTYYQKWIIICVYLVIVKRAHATAKVARAVKTRYQVLSYFITVTLPHSICQKQGISFRILRKCIQVKTKKGERRSSSCVHVGSNGSVTYIRWWSSYIRWWSSESEIFSP